MNNCTFIGNICNDLESEEVGKGKNSFNKVKFTIACKDTAEHTDFIFCEATGTTCDNIIKYFEKGSRIGINGKLHTYDYEDRKGNKLYGWCVSVKNFEFCEKAGK